MQQHLEPQATPSSDEHRLGGSSPRTAAAVPQHEQRRAFEAALARRIAALLGSSKTMAPAVGLLLHFQELAALACDREAVLGELAAAGQLGLAMCWADQLGPSFQVLHLWIPRGFLHGRYSWFWANRAFSGWVAEDVSAVVICCGGKQVVWNPWAFRTCQTPLLPACTDQDEAVAAECAGKAVRGGRPPEGRLHGGEVLRAASRLPYPATGLPGAHPAAPHGQAAVGRSHQHNRR